MTAITGARLSMDVLASVMNATLAIILIKETGWRSLIPALLMCSLLWRLDHVNSPQPILLVAAIAACVIVLVARGPALRSLRVAGVVVCALSTATMQLLGRL
jgi:hypothetical protein